MVCTYLVCLVAPCWFLVARVKKTTLRTLIWKNSDKYRNLYQQRFLEMVWQASVDFLACRLPKNQNKLKNKPIFNDITDVWQIMKQRKLFGLILQENLC